MLDARGDRADGYVIWRLDWPGVRAMLDMAGLLPLDQDTLGGLMRMAEGAAEALNCRSDRT